jgi:hypothetical protein
MKLSDFKRKLNRRLPVPLRPAALSYFRVSYSQFGEDLFLSSLFSEDFKTGFYVDVGCYRPVQDSNTYRLYQKGWSGIAVDATPRWRNEWASVRPRDKFVNQAIAGTTRNMHYCFDKLYATCSRLVDVEAGGVLPSAEDPRYEITSLVARPLDHVLFEHRVARAFEFLNVDCEGFDLQVIQTLDFEKYRPAVIAIEDHHVVCDSETTAFLQGKAYTLAAMIGYTKIFRSQRS